MQKGKRVRWKAGSVCYDRFMRTSALIFSIVVRDESIVTPMAVLLNEIWKPNENKIWERRYE